MRYMFDTNILIYLLKKKPHSVIERANALGPDDSVCMSFVSWAELLKGPERSTQPEAVRLRLGALAQLVPVRYQASPELCQHHARLAAALRREGRPIGANELWIAAHALADDCVLVTNNLREFERIPGLTLENWAA